MRRLLKPLLRSRAVSVPLLAAVAAGKRLGIRPDAFPGQLGRIAEHWTLPMLSLYTRSLGRRVYMDQPCSLSLEAQPRKCQVAEPYRLSEAELETFYKDGVIGPFTVLTESEMVSFGERLKTVLRSPSAVYGFTTVRDRHLDCPELLRLFRMPAITERVAQLLGPNLVLWRSQFFDQAPGAGPIAWHQESTYMVESYRAPLLRPPNCDELFQVSVWIAVDRATQENGCLQVARGTHNRIREVRIDGGSEFYHARFALDFSPEPETLFSAELLPGQFVIFTERCVHGSRGNPSSKPRLGVNCRIVTPQTRIYPGLTSHYAMHLKEKYDLSRWGAVLIRGVDPIGMNRPFNEDLSALKRRQRSDDRS